MKMPLLLLCLLYLTCAASAQEYKYSQKSVGTWGVVKVGEKYRILDLVRGEFARPESFEYVSERVSSDGTIAARLDGKVCLIRAKDYSLALPAVYPALGMSMYCAEVGWSHTTQTYGGFTGFRNSDGKWGFLDRTGEVVVAPKFREILLNAYFFKGHSNPFGGMLACREQAVLKGQKILAFTSVKPRSVSGYLTTDGHYVAMDPGLELRLGMSEEGRTLSIELENFGSAKAVPSSICPQRPWVSAIAFKFLIDGADHLVSLSFEDSTEGHLHEPFRIGTKETLTYEIPLSSLFRAHPDLREAFLGADEIQIQALLKATGEARGEFWHGHEGPLATEPAWNGELYSELMRVR